MATFQMTLDDDLKANVDELFEDLGLDTETAVRMFFKASLARNGIPFGVKHYKMPDDLEEAIRDVRMKKICTVPLTLSKKQWHRCWRKIEHVSSHLHETNAQRCSANATARQRPFKTVCGFGVAENGRPFARNLSRPST